MFVNVLGKLFSEKKKKNAIVRIVFWGHIINILGFRLPLLENTGNTTFAIKWKTQFISSASLKWDWSTKVEEIEAPSPPAALGLGKKHQGWIDEEAPRFVRDSRSADLHCWIEDIVCSRSIHTDFVMFDFLCMFSRSRYIFWIDLHCWIGDFVIFVRFRWFLDLHCWNRWFSIHTDFACSISVHTYYFLFVFVHIDDFSVWFRIDHILIYIHC